MTGKVKRRSSAEVKAAKEQVKKAKENATFIKPAIRVNGQDHVIETLFKQGKTPKFAAVGVSQLEPGKNSWVSYLLEIVGDKVVSMEVGEPNLRAIAEEEAKIGFVTKFLDAEVI